MHLYQHHRLEECGGVDPRAGLFRKWAIADKRDAALTALGISAVEELAGTNAAVFEVRGGDTLVYKTFADQALFSAPDQARQARFWHAFRNLHAHGFIYETIAVWTADPAKDRAAEPLYTLYIRDAHARENGEPYLQRVVHSVSQRILGFEAWRLWTDEFATPGLIEACAAIGGGFRFVGAKTRPGHPIGIYRVRFRPHDRETGLGFEREEGRVREWARMLRKLAR